MQIVNKLALLFLLVAALSLPAQHQSASVDKPPLDRPIGQALQASNSPVRNHLVDTVLGPRERLSLGDSKLDATLGSVLDFLFLSDNDVLLADATANLVYRAGPDGLVRVFAGNGQRVHSGDGGSALAAGIPSPRALAATASGEVYIADRDGRVRRVSLQGVVETVAGTGEPGCPTESAPATATALRAMTSMAVDRDGVLYLAPSLCGAVYRVDAQGTLRMFAGNMGTPGTPGAKTFPAGSRDFNAVSDLRVTDSGDVLFSATEGSTRAYFRVTPGGIAQIIGHVRGFSVLREGNSSDMLLTGVQSFALRDDGSILVASSVNFQSATSGYELGAIDTNGVYSIVFTRDGFGGKPKGEFNGAFAAPWLLRLDPSGRPHFLDRFRRSILRVQADGAIQPVVGRFQPSTTLDAGGVPGRMDFLARLAVDSQQRTYFHTNRIFRLNLDGSVTHIAGDGTGGGRGDGVPAVSTGLGSFRHLATDAAGNIYTNESTTTAASSRPTGVVRQIAPDGIIRIIAGGGAIGGDLEGIAATNAILGDPVDHMAVSPNGEVYVTERHLSSSTRVWKRRLDGTLTRVFGILESSGGVLPAAGVPAKEARNAFIDSILPQPDGSLILSVRMGSSNGVFRIDAQGLLQQVVNANQNQTFVDGAPTLNAPSQFAANPVVLATGRFLTVIPNVGLAEYVDAGNVRLWDGFTEGAYRSDGDTLARDLNSDFLGVQAFADGSLVWAEPLFPDSVIRRSVVVPAGCTYAVNTPLVTVPAAGSVIDVSLSTGSGCPWVLGASSHWVQWQGAPRGSGPVTLQVTMAANPSPIARAASMTIAGQRIQIEQGGNPATSLFWVSPGKSTLGPSAGALKFDVFAGPGTTWQVTLPAGLSLDGALTGSGPGSRVVRVPANLTAAPRVFSVLVNGLAIEITQAASAMMVPVTITGNDPNAKIIVDQQERSLPYTTQWLVGSTHTLSGPEWDRIDEASLRQFLGWGSTNQRELTVTVPASPVALQATHRRLHALRLDARPEPIGSGNPQVAFQFPGVPVPSLVLLQLQMLSVPYYVEGEDLPVLAVGERNFEFVRWAISPLASSGPAQTQERTANPTTVRVNGPTQLTAQFRFVSGAISPLRTGSAPPLVFQDRVSPVNPIAVSVDAWNPQDAPPVTGIFFTHSFASLRGVNWMQARVTNQGRAPFVLELQPDTLVPYFANAAEFSAQGAVYLVMAGRIPASIPVSLTVRRRPTSNAPNILAVTDAGGFRQGAGTTDFPVAGDSILTLFGENLATNSQSAAAVPLPLGLADTAVEYFHSQTNLWRPLPLFFVSPFQVNFHVPREVVAGTSESSISVRVRKGAVASESTRVFLTPASATLFTANSSGIGAPAGFYIRVRPNGVQERGELFFCQSGSCTARPVPRGTGNRVFLELYGSGFSQVDAGNILVLLGDRRLQPEFAGANSGFVGLSQLNVELPADLPSGVDLDLYLWVRSQSGNPWISSNRVTIRLQ